MDAVIGVEQLGLTFMKVGHLFCYLSGLFVLTVIACTNSDLLARFALHCVLIDVGIS